MSKVKALLKDVSKPNGYKVNSKSKLFGLIIVDKDDSEDTSLELWVVDNEEQLRKAKLAEYAGDGEDSEELSYMEQEFDNDWGIYLLPKDLGTTLTK